MRRSNGRSSCSPPSTRPCKSARVCGVYLLIKNPKYRTDGKSAPSYSHADNTSRWALIIFTESAGFESYEIEVAGLRATCEQEHHLQRTRAKDLIVLIDDAAIAKVKIDPLMERIRDIAVCKAVVPEGLKPLDRVIERAMMDPLNNLTNTADMVRYRFVGANMKRIGVVLAEFHKSPDLRIVDVIDGFAHCEGIEGWRS